jgi:glutaminyl-peptide cyclotransferase
MNLSTKLYILLSFPLFFLSCNDDATSYSLQISNSDNSLKLGESLTATIKNPKEKVIDSVTYNLNSKSIASLKNNNPLSVALTNNKLGEHTLIATVYSEGKATDVSANFKLFNNKPPESYTFEIINTYPHDANAFTQGLEFYNGNLYESTGRNGQSTIRKVNLETGEVLQSSDLDIDYFGEGITALNDKLYQLTWQGKKGFVYDINTFEQLDSFSYNASKEGWGLCNDGTKLYKSDGTSKIWILNAETLAEEDYIQTVSHKTISKKLNELEWVNGKIYANNWQIDLISIINPKNGAIEGLVDFRSLRKQVSSATKEDVLNGIAYNKETGKLYVTGKNWDKLFEVKIIKK